jgi:hypothetical protein
MTTREFHHFGVPTTVQQDDEIWIDGGKVFVTDAEKHPFRVEFLRFEPGSPMPEAVRTRSHAAFVVGDLAAEVQGREVIVPPFDANEELRVAFIKDGDAVIELMEMKRS